MFGFDAMYNCVNCYVSINVESMKLRVVQQLANKKIKKIRKIVQYGQENRRSDGHFHVTKRSIPSIDAFFEFLPSSDNSEAHAFRHFQCQSWEASFSL